VHGLQLVDVNGDPISAYLKRKHLVGFGDIRFIDISRDLLLFNENEFMQILIRGSAYHVIITNVSNKAALITLLDTNMKQFNMFVDIHMFSQEIGTLFSS